MQNLVKKYRESSAVLYLIIATIPLVIPYASNASVILLALPILSLLPFDDLKRDFAKAFKSVLGKVVFAFSFFGFLTAFYSISPQNSMALSLRLFVLYLAFVVFNTKLKTLEVENIARLKKMFIYSILFTLFLYGIDVCSNLKLAYFIKGWDYKNDNHMFNKIGRGASILSMLVWAGFLILHKMKRTFFTPVLFFGVCFFVLCLLPMGAVVLAAIVGACAFFTALLLKRKTLILMGFVIVLYSLTAPVFFTKISNLENANQYVRQLPMSWKHRVVIWEYASNKILKKPFLGYGMDSTRFLGRNVPKIVIDPYNPVEKQTKVPQLILHPHNGILQIWLELGLVGVLFFCALIIGIFRKIAMLENDKIAFSTAIAMFSNFFVIFSLSFGVWQNWWLAGCLLAASFFNMNFVKFIPTGTFNASK
jgi:O-antigen ligase